ncbi:MAG TPA: peptide chain release factor N(5)-glutamine methyltransferase [Beijerinckiaceae bacterium]|nr:peptide chain release factor N(5)-glutamine methyltransferase [Beijerinckiaceae bacterium]
MPPPPDIPPGASRAEALAAMRAAFRAAGLGEADLDARVLLAAALGVDGTELALRPERRLAADEAARAAVFAARRLGREPVGRILGRREFWGLSFALAPETLEPRPDTETVVETALRLVPDPRPLRLLDLGTGSGCLLVALLHERPAASGIGVDRSPAALATARRNAAANGVGERAVFVAADWGAALAGGFDLVVANPPYIASVAIAALAPEVRAHDPRAALDGGADGLDAYRAILADAARLLAPDGVLVVEIGFDQQSSVGDLAVAAGLEGVTLGRDLGGRVRALAFKCSPAAKRQNRGSGA